ncbi:MAG TPA: ImmA/IrrE family metallo-endopeptidase [Candidatus Udaeobacter sp.]|nr:ImmA/IrrE family metallo-endopeptidase [Candidatus Udaeobacter sp.]
MISIIREREIIQCAADVIRDNGFTSLPVDPRKIASAAKIELMPWNPDKLGISGFLMRAGEDFGIGYSTAIQNQGFINFTIAHELGHYFLSGHVEAVIGYGSGIHYSASGFVSNDVHEREADALAAELLMPQSFFKSALQNAGVGFNAIQTLAEAAGTSIVATAIRFAKLADDPVAVVLTTGSQVEWCFVSNELRKCRGVYPLGKRSVLPATSTTAKFNSDSARIDRAEQEEGCCSLRDWFENAVDLEVKEDVVGLGHYGKTLTVLFADELPTEDDDGPEDEEEDTLTGLPSSRWRARDQSRLA